MILYTDRLTLKEITIDDIPWIHLLNSIPEVDKYNTLGLPNSIVDTENLIYPIIEDQKKVPRPRYVWLVQDIEQNNIGLTGLVMGKPNYATAEIWYKIMPTFWNNGYATEFVSCLLSFAFNNIKLHRVIAGCAVENLASIRVLEKTGFIKEAHHRKILPIRGEWVDNYEYAILEEDYFKTNPYMTREHHYQLKAVWQGNNVDGNKNIRTYDRSHTVMIDGKPELKLTTDNATVGDKSKLNPEDLLVSAIASCHMLSYLYICSLEGIIITSYTDHATGIMIENEAGGGSFKEVRLSPICEVAEESMIAKAIELHHKAHDICYIANSVNFKVSCLPICKVK